MKYFPLLAALMLVSTSALAQTAAAPAPASSNQPIEITATETVEWLRNQNQYVARKDVIVKQGAMEIHSDLLTADYREGAQSSTEIWQLTAEGNVQVKDETTTAYGDRGVYDVPKGVAVLTGGNLRLVSPDQTVTATERMEYYANERMAKAIGNATVLRAEDKVQANVLTAYFKDDTAQPAAKEAGKKPAGGALGGGGNIDRLEADGNVVITTPTEKITGSKAVYRAATNTADITGKVKLVRGENVLEGERAEVNLTTNVSKMFGSKTESGRVRGVFFPGSDSSVPGKKAADKKAIAAPAAAATPPGKAAPAPEPAPDAAPPAEAPAVSPTPETPAPAKVSPRVEY